jgi:sugar lactone lactonase YvrE
MAQPGTTIATDAGGNSLLRIAASGSIATLATLPSRAQGRFTDSVPTTVAVGPDGAYYIGELTGFPFVPGEAKIYRVVPGEAPTVYRSGFSFVIDIAFGSDGSLYVLEFATGPGLSGPGDLWRVAPGGARSLVATGLFAPGSVTIGPDGAFYVSNCSIFPGTGPFPCHGAVVRIRG